MSKRTGPAVRGTKKDGSPRVYEGQLPKLAHARPMTDQFIVVAGGAFVSVQTAERTELFPVAGGAFPGRGLTCEQLHRIDIGLDYYDAANEDAHGRLPHQPGYGSPLVLVPDPPAEADVIPIHAVRSDAA